MRCYYTHEMNKMFARATVLLCISSSLLLLSFTDTATAQRRGDLRLARGFSSSSYSSGRLEIYINGQWGTVCDDSFSITDARVACRQLGYSGASRTTAASRISSFRSGFGQIWLDDVGCSSSDTCLLSCPSRGIGSHNCDHSEDVAIYCYGSRIITPRVCSSAQRFPATTRTTDIGGAVNNIVGIIVGVSIAGFVVVVVIPIVICVVIICCVVGGVGAAASSSRRPHTVVTTSQPPAATTATVVTTGSQQAAYPAQYPAQPLDPYPPQAPQ